MVQAVSGEVARPRRKMRRSKGSGDLRWSTHYIGTRPEREVEDRPQAFLVEMSVNGTVMPHFHQVDQFQVLVAGSGTLGRNAVPLLAVHYADHHTAYGPIHSGPHGLSFFTIRAKADPGAIYLHKPGYREMLKPTKKRYLLATNIDVSTEPVLQSRSEVMLEKLLPEEDDGDGLGVFMLRMGAGMKTTGPDPRTTGGQFYLVVNGGLQFEGASYQPWSTLYAERTDMPLELCAGPGGLEALVLNFPRSQT